MELDSRSPSAAPGTLTVGLYTPYLQGFYIGELVNQIRQLCFVKGYRLVVIRTGGYGKFQSALQLDQIDCAIFIRNSVSAEFADTLFVAKPCVAIAYDFFPLAIPVVASDHEFGIGFCIAHLAKCLDQKVRALFFHQAAHEQDALGTTAQVDRPRHEMGCVHADVLHGEPFWGDAEADRPRPDRLGHRDEMHVGIVREAQQTVRVSPPAVAAMALLPPFALDLDVEAVQRHQHREGGGTCCWPEINGIESEVGMNKPGTGSA